MTPFQPQNHPKNISTYNYPAPITSGHHGSNPPNSHGIPLKPVSLLPDVYRSFFKFGVFNAIQSRCYDTIMNTHDNMVVSAPTGSGKTVLFELALIRLLMETNADKAKCVYMAPTKALCSERHRDWARKLEPIGIKCCELTGDTIGFGRHVWGDAKDSSVIITTPEKFDSLSRNWRDHNNILSQTRLFLIDEVHILNESRGSTLEVVANRMKSRGTSVRFLLVSATVPNIDDIAEWIGNGTSDDPATVFNFGDEFRPCKLTRVVYGYPRKGQNDFSFAQALDYKVFPLLQKHSEDKPVLVFCATRKGVVKTAQVLAKEYQTLVESKKMVPWARPKKIDVRFQDSQLQELAISGIGVHHAGLTLDDRRITEDLFLKKILRVVIATSTLAVGVNLPAHTVVVKGVKMWINGEWQEYSDLDFIQMIGRAGRPQYDKEGVAVILCDTDQEPKYKALVSGQTLLESCLHVNLSEHLNSEIGLNTITDLATAKKWLHGSFLFQRIQKNAPYYSLDKNAGQTWQSRLDELVESSIKDLRENELVTDNAGDGSFTSTEYGEIMSKYYIRMSTMGLILKLPENSTLRDIIEMIASAAEIDLRLRAGEKQIYKKIGDHNDIRFRTKIDKPSDKVFVLIQAVLGGISLSSPEYKTSDSQPYLEALTVFKHASRIARTIVEVAIVKKSGAMLKHGMELVRSLNAKAWEDRPMVLRQIEQIGEKSIKVLAENGIVTLGALRQASPARIECLLNRRPPFGNAVLAAARDLPQFTLRITEVSVSSFKGKGPVLAEVNIECGLLSVSEPRSVTAKGKNTKAPSLGMTCVLTLTSDNDFVDFRRIPTKALREPKSFKVGIQLTKPSQTVIARISPDNFAGLTVSETYRPSVDPQEYPTRDTRPAHYDVDAVLAGLEDDPTFWQIADVELSGDEIGRELIEICATEFPLIASHSSDVSSVAEISAPKSHDKPKSKCVAKYDTKAKMCHPTRRSNGNYECLHTCKDKAKCRHLCCRDGLSRPPKKASHQPARSGISTETTSQVPVVRPEPAIKTQKKGKKPLASDNDLKHLETLHQRSGGLELPAGRRLKLDASEPATSNKSEKNNWNMELTFTDLEKTVKPNPLVDEGEDLPDPHDFLSRRPLKPATAQNFTPDNSDQGMNVSSVPPVRLHEDEDSLVSQRFETTSSVSNQFTKDQSDVATTVATRRRPRLTESCSPLASPANKRPRLGISSAIARHQNAPKRNNTRYLTDSLTTPDTHASDSAHNSPRDQKVPLFLDEALENSEGDIDAVMSDDEAFVFDADTFDMGLTPFSLGNQSPAQGNLKLGANDGLMTVGRKLDKEDELDNSTTADLQCAQTRGTGDLMVNEGRLDDYAQGLAEFEAWLKSGAVEITEKAIV